MPLVVLPEFSRRLTPGFTLALPKLELAAGEWVCITGANGSGKSSLLEMLAGTHSLHPERHDTLNNEIVLVQANPENQIFFQRVEQELVFPLENRALSRNYIGRRLEQVTSTLKLEPLLRRDPWKLSGGQKQLVVLAVALMQKPQAWFLDDALAYLDVATAATVIQLLQRERDEGKLLVTVTQDARELKLCDRVLHLAAGRLLFDGTAVEFSEFLQAEHPDWSALTGAELQEEKVEQGIVSTTPRAPTRLAARRLEYAWSPGYPVVSEQNLELPDGSLVHLQGEMGCGKTTLALLLAGLLQPAAGSIRLGEQELCFQAGDSFAGAGISYAFQYPEHQFLLPTFRRELEFQGSTANLSAITSLLENFDLSREVLDEPLATLPRGHRRLLALLELLTSEQAVLLLDEPFIGLDIPTRRRLITLLRELRHPGRCIVVIDHLIQGDRLGADLLVKLQAPAQKLE